MSQDAVYLALGSAFLLVSAGLLAYAHHLFGQTKDLAESLLSRPALVHDESCAWADSNEPCDCGLDDALLALTNYRRTV